MDIQNAQTLGRCPIYADLRPKDKTLELCSKPRKGLRPLTLSFEILLSQLFSFAKIFDIMNKIAKRAGDYMLTFEESRKALTQIADALPSPIFKALNGGIILLPDTITDDYDLLILGEYHVEPYGFGRYITIHYGSMKEAYGNLGPRTFFRKLEEVLHHELVHHLEDLAGDRSLDIQDAVELEKLLNSKRKRGR